MKSLKLSKHYDNENISVVFDPKQPMYVIYISGSPGKKGVGSNLGRTKGLTISELAILVEEKLIESISESELEEILKEAGE